MSLCLNPECGSLNSKDASICEGCNQSLLLQGRYRALSKIGNGGFGKTFKATDEGKPSKPYCVIKQLFYNDAGTRAKTMELFQQEAVQLAILGDHSQIPALLWHGEQEGEHYIVQEYIDGHNLEDELAQKGAYSEANVWQLLGDILPVLERIHAVKVIHRDIKPENIIWRGITRILVLVDFGAVKVGTQTALAKTGTSIGSAEYVAPEQARGKAVFASDLYSLGVTCIHLLTQISPFQLYSDEEGSWVWRDFLPSGVKMSAKLGKVLDKLLESALSRRYRSAKEVLQDMKSSVAPVSPQVVAEPKSEPNLADPPVVSVSTVRTLQGHSHIVQSVGFSPNGQTLASGSKDKTIKLSFGM